MDYVYKGVWSADLRTKIQTWIDKKWSLWGAENPGSELTDFIQESLENKKPMAEFSADFLDLELGEDKAKELALELSNLLENHEKQSKAQEETQNKKSTVEPFERTKPQSGDSMMGPLKASRQTKSRDQEQHTEENRGGRQRRDTGINGALSSSREGNHQQQQQHQHRQQHQSDGQQTRAGNVHSRLGKRQLDNEVEQPQEAPNNRNVRQRQQQQAAAPSSSTAPNPLADQLRYMEELNRVAVQSGFKNAKEMLEMTNGGGAAPSAPPAAPQVHPGYPPAAGAYHAPYGGGRGGYHYPPYPDPTHGAYAPHHGYQQPYYPGPGGPGGRFPGGRGGRMGRGGRFAGRGEASEGAGSAETSMDTTPAASAAVDGTDGTSATVAAASAEHAAAAAALAPADSQAQTGAPGGGIAPPYAGRGAGRGGRGSGGRFAAANAAVGGHNPFAQQPGAAAAAAAGPAETQQQAGVADASQFYPQQQQYPGGWYRGGGGRGRGGRFNPHYQHPGFPPHAGGGRFAAAGGPGAAVAGGRHANKTWVRQTDTDSSLVAPR